MTDIDLLAALATITGRTREQLAAMPPYRCPHGTPGWCEPCEARMEQAADRYDPDAERVTSRRPA